MATEPHGLSLTLELLEAIQPGAYGTSPGENPSATQAAKYLEWRDTRDAPVSTATAKEEARNKLRQVQESLYKALYQIIDSYEQPYANVLNMAIGKALAIVIKDTNIGPSQDPKLRADIQRLIKVLKPIVTEAVDAVDEYKATEAVDASNENKV
jgi:hypothetical protein